MSRKTTSYRHLLCVQYHIVSSMHVVARCIEGISMPQGLLFYLPCPAYHLGPSSPSPSLLQRTFPPCSPIFSILKSAVAALPCRPSSYPIGLRVRNPGFFYITSMPHTCSDTSLQCRCSDRCVMHESDYFVGQLLHFFP